MAATTPITPRVIKTSASVNSSKYFVINITFHTKIQYLTLVKAFYKIQLTGEIMSTKKELLGMRIKEIRENRKFTQDKLAEMVGIDPKHLSRIENGRNYPSFETLEKILDSLNVSYEDIFNYTHFATKTEMISKINAKLSNLNNEKLTFIFKMVNEI